ncbi:MULTISPECIES: MaoC family dehydratase [Prauserella salsuginis group]|uniref:MaoC family dehydratase n=1 Tax=Prauserella salsuginis TaxID=387889 RepID=A0ABW6G0S6_9PSEU|nr:MULTISPECIES: MaoC family dehydratase [Prauserella salsuginis group]MCR3721937.1 Acyl dehydratase [Prauserella flava]MCR3735943.1 Acyl dehydratase [Prauserella salsuginis]
MNTEQKSVLAFADLVEGTQYVSAGRTVTETDIQNFAGLSGDFNPLHTDEEWVRANTSYERRIAHGLLVLAISSGARTPGYDDLDIRAYLSESRDMTAPTYPGDTITVTNTVSGLRPSRSKPGHGIVTFTVNVTNQRGEMVQSGTDVLLIGHGRSG